MSVNQSSRLSFFPLILFALFVGFPSSTRAQAQSPFLGSVPNGQVSATPLKLSLQQAFDRALKYNLGAIESDQETRAAHAVRLRNLNALLPDLTARASYALEQIDLRAQGLNISIPGAHIPPPLWALLQSRTHGVTCPRKFSIGPTFRVGGPHPSPNRRRCIRIGAIGTWWC